MDLLVENVPVAKLRVGNLGGKTWMQLRRDENLVPPWDKLLQAPLWSDTQFALLRNRLRKGKGTRVLGPVEHNAGAEVGRSVHGVTLQDGDTKKEVVWGNLIGVMRHRPVDVVYCELEGDDDVLDPRLMEELAKDKPPGLIVFGTGGAIKNVIEQLQDNCANQISTGCVVTIFMETDAPRGPRRRGELNVERKAFLYSPHGIIGHLSYAIIRVSDIGALIPMYLLDLSAENPAYAQLEDVPVSNMVVIPGSSVTTDQCIDYLAQLTSAMSVEWTASIVTPSILESEDAMQSTLKTQYEKHLMRCQRVAGDIELLMGGMPVTNATRNVKDDVTMKDEREKQRQLKRQEKERKREARQQSKEERRRQREDERIKQRQAEEAASAEAAAAEYVAPFISEADEEDEEVPDSDEEDQLQRTVAPVTRACDEREKERQARERALKEEAEQRRKVLEATGRKRQKAEEEASVAPTCKRPKPTAGFTAGGVPKPQAKRRMGLYSPKPAAKPKPGAV